MPTAVICSDEFGPLGRAESTVLGQPGLPLVAIPHPLADNDAPLVEAKGKAIVDQVVDALTGDPAALADHYRTTFARLTQRRLEAGRMCLDDTCVALVPPLLGEHRPRREGDPTPW